MFYSPVSVAVIVDPVFKKMFYSFLSGSTFYHGQIILTCK